MIMSSIEGEFLGGDMYNEIKRQNIRLTHLGTVALTQNVISEKIHGIVQFVFYFKIIRLSNTVN